MLDKIPFELILNIIKLYDVMSLYKINKYFTYKIKELIEMESNKYGGINGFRYNYIYDILVEKRNIILFKNIKNYNFRNWTNKHFVNYGLCNIHSNKQKMSIWLCLNQDN